MDNLEIVIVSSSFEHIEVLNSRLYNDIIRDGYHNLVSESKDGTFQSLTIF